MTENAPAGDAPPPSHCVKAEHPVDGAVVLLYL